MTIGFNHLGRHGRLGNQMFQYAGLRGIAAHRGFDFMIPESNFKDEWYTDHCPLKMTEEKWFMACRQVNLFIFYCHCVISSIWNIAFSTSSVLGKKIPRGALFA